MKALTIMIGVLWSMNVVAQTVHKQKRKSAGVKPKTQQRIFVADTSKAPVRPLESITGKRLKGSAGSQAANTASADSNPFVSGIHPAPDARQQFDSVAPNNPNSIYNANTARVSASAEANDTTINVNSINQGGSTTISGAVDKSGQTQFGQTNWGESRRTIGESQWTLPPPVSSAFSRDNLSATNITWSRGGADSGVYMARYQMGADWILASYNATGGTLDRRTEITLQQLPQPVNSFLQRQIPAFKAIYVNRLQMQGKPEVYEVKTTTGQIIYLNMEGREVKF